MIVKDLANNKHVLCAGIDINPALVAQGKNAAEIATQVQEECRNNGGSALLNKNIKTELQSIAKVLNIAWMERGLEQEALLICRRSNQCPRVPSCDSKGNCVN